MAAQGFNMRATAETKRNLDRMVVARVTPEMKREIQVVTQAIVPEVRAAARGISAQEPYSPGGLRAALAKAVRRSVKSTERTVNAEVSCHGSRSNPLANISNAVEGVVQWKHPTFGHDPTVEQKSDPFFFRTMERVVPATRLAFQKAMIRYERKL